MSAAARRYADALMESVANHSPEAQASAAEELGRLSTTVEEVFDLKNALENPSYSSEERRRVLDAVMEQLEVSDRIQNFARLIVDRGRASELKAIAATFSGLLDERAGRVKAHVSSAQPLSDGDAQQIREALEQRIGKNVDIELSVNPELIGGIRAQVGTIVYDGSIRAQLDRLKETLSVS